MCEGTAQAVKVPSLSQQALAQSHRAGADASAAAAAWIFLPYAASVATKPQAAANISQTPGTARLPVAWIR